MFLNRIAKNVGIPIAMCLLATLHVAVYTEPKITPVASLSIASNFSNTIH